MSLKRLKSVSSVQLPFAFGADYLLQYEGINRGITWNNMFDSDFSFGRVIQLMFLDSVLYLLLSLYLEMVLPGEYGSTHPWYFCCTPWFWKRSVCCTICCNGSSFAIFFFFFFFWTPPLASRSIVVCSFIIFTWHS